MDKIPKVAFVMQPIDIVLPPSRTSIGIWAHEAVRRLAKSRDVMIERISYKPMHLVRGRYE
jgi:hypothetical protein